MRSLLLCLAGILCVTTFVRADDVVYSKSIAPILRTYCLGCHSRSESEGGLSLQSPDDLLRGGRDGAVLNRDAPMDSRMLAVLKSTSEDQMPPADEPQPTVEERRLLEQWILDGARFDTSAAVMPALPKVPVRHASANVPGAIQFSRDGSRVLKGSFRKAELKTSGGQNAVSLALPDGKVTDVQFSADETRALVATGTSGLSGRAVEISLATSEVIREFAGATDLLYAAVWSPDEQLVATAGYDRRIRLYNATTGQLLREMNGHNGAVFDLTFNPDGTLLASASADATIKIWQTATGERLDTLSQPQAEQYSVAFSPNNQFVFAAGADSRIRKWQLLSKTTPIINPLLVSRFAHEGTIVAMRMTADGSTLVTAAESGTVKIWDTATVSEQSAHSLHGEVPVTVSLNEARRRAVIVTTHGDQIEIPLPSSFRSSVLTAMESSERQTLPDAIPITSVTESETGSDMQSAQAISFPSTIAGTIQSADGTTPDADLYRFEARKGQPVLIEVRAERDKSPLDSRIDILTEDGQPVLQARMQAVRDSYFTFRGKDSDTTDDFRVFNWQEMELNEYLYADGEVVKLWLYPRGPDSGFKVYPGFGPRQTYFNTTPTTHPLQGPAYIVEPYAPDVELRDTGLPIFPIYYENDDDPMRQWGRDSRLMFDPPADGNWLVRIRDSRDQQGADYRYQLTVRTPAPDFSAEKNVQDLKIHPGTGREIVITATRLEGYDGPIEIVANNLPPGFSLSDPVIIQNEQRQAFATLIAAVDAAAPTAEAVAGIRFVARARIQGRMVERDLGGLKSLELLQKPRVVVRIQSDEQHAAGSREHTPELTVYAGETVRAWLTVERNEHPGLVEFGKEDSGRNMPHGVFVDNIGLNGLMLLDGQNEREFFITTAKWVPESSRPFYLKSNVDGNITSLPVMLQIRHRNPAVPLSR